MKTTQRSGSALIITLWVLVILSLLIGTFAFNMHIEAGISSYYRKRLQAQYLAQAGVELAKVILIRSAEAGGGAEEEEELDEIGKQAERLVHGGSVKITRELGRGKIDLTIHPAESRRNVNRLQDPLGWDDVFDEANVPDDVMLRQELVHCFFDWTDPNDTKHADGAESDDSFYEDRGYEVKDGPLDTVDELMLIKGFTTEILFGGVPEDSREAPMKGIIHTLTTWSDGRVNPNAADFRTLMTLPGIIEEEANGILAWRRGADGVDGTEDDELFEDVNQAVVAAGGLSAEAQALLTVQEIKYIRVDSIGEVGKGKPVRSGISCMIRLDRETARAVFWHEGILP